MISHVWGRASLYKKWDLLAISSYDDEIINYCKNNKINVIRTGDHHKRALDRVEEAVKKIDSLQVNDEDIIVNVQGDEPMIHPNMFQKLIYPIINYNHVNATILSMPITNEKLWRNPIP